MKRKEERKALSGQVNEAFQALKAKRLAKRRSIAASLGITRRELKEALDDPRSMSVELLADLFFVLGHRLVVNVEPLPGDEPHVIEKDPVNSTKPGD